MVDLLSRPVADLAAMGNAGRAHIAAHYTIERMCDATLALYQEVIGNQR
jgi:hypothetical protein